MTSLATADTKRCETAIGGQSATPGAFVCPVDKRPCEVAALLAPHLERPPAEALRPVQHLLPCNRCRWVEQQIQSLPRLGKHERRILLAAPAPDGEPAINEPAALGRSAAESACRAARKLAEGGLLHVSYRDQVVTPWRKGYGYRITKTVFRQAVRLTPLGAAVVALVRPLLESGKPIRWDRHRAILVDMVRENARALVPRFSAQVDEYAAEQKSMRDIIARLGRRPEAAQETSTAQQAVEAVQAACRATLA
jgi:hypothetical protein